jgi:transcription elongation factor GreB
MSKAFVKESDEDIEDESSEPQLAKGVKNYITPGGYNRLKNELEYLLNKERPDVVNVVAWAASNGDRSENADYIYGKKRLREIDRRIRFLTKRLDIAEIVDPQLRADTDQIFFGATVTIRNSKNEKKKISIVGIDEINLEKGHVSWVSPIAQALIKTFEGDTVILKSPSGHEEIEVLEVKYQAIH